MNRNILRTTCNDMQFFSALKDGRMNNISPSTVQFIYKLVREYAKFDLDGAHLFVSDIPFIDKQIFLSHLLEAEDYEHYCSSKSLLTTAIEEYEPEMQRLISQYQDDVWHDDMQEMGLKLCFHKDNGEIYYS